MSLAPSKAGILICPKGPTFGSISKEQWDNFQAAHSAGSGEVRSVTAEIFGLYFSNIKEYTLRYLHQPVPGPPTIDRTYTLAQCADYSIEGFEAPNVGSAPLPQNYWSSLVVNSPAILLEHVGQQFPGVRYYQSAAGAPGTGIEDLVNPENYIVFNFFIYNDGLYCFIPFRFGPTATRVVIVSLSQIKISETLGTAFVEVTFTPTQKYYN